MRFFGLDEAELRGSIYVNILVFSNPQRLLTGYVFGGELRNRVCACSTGQQWQQKEHQARFRHHLRHLYPLTTVTTAWRIAWPSFEA